MLVFRIKNKFFKFGSGVGFWKNEIWFNGNVNNKIADKIVNYLENTEYDEVSFCINSGGGDTDAMEKIIDAIEKFNQTKTLNTYCFGMVASSAFEIFLCGKERTITTDSQLMFHDAVCNFYSCGKSAFWTIRELKQQIQKLTQISDVSRIWVAQRTGLSVSALKKMTKNHKEKWFSVDECLKYKIATKVLD